MRSAAELQTLPDLLRMRARIDPDRRFVSHAGRAYTYGEFDARTDELAGGLAELGVGPGDVVSVFLPNRLEFLEAWWAILKAGAVFGPINPAYTGQRGRLRARSLAGGGGCHRCERRRRHRKRS